MSQNKISRRDAIKLLGAALGGAALSTIPPTWSKPALAASQLPEHARQSVGLHVFDKSELTFPFGGSISVSILPPDGGIRVRWSFSNVMEHAPKNAKLAMPPSGEATTDNDGVATVDVNSDCQNLEVHWSFVYSSDGTDTCDQKYYCD